MKNVKIIVAIVGIALAAYLIINNLKSNTAEVGFVVQCDKCGKAYKADIVPTPDAFPAECKFCKSKSVYRLLHCKDCSSYYTFHPGEDTSCPDCGSLSYDQPDQVPE